MTIKPSANGTQATHPHPTHPTHGMRRGGARRGLTERVSLTAEDGVRFEGWALNLSRGGLRAILEHEVLLGQKFDIRVGDSPARASRVVWVQQEPDGIIVGLEFAGPASPLKPSSRTPTDQHEGEGED